MIRYLSFDMSETSIPCSKAIRDKIRDCGKKGDSWEKVLNEMYMDAMTYRKLKVGSDVQ